MIAERCEITLAEVSDVTHCLSLNKVLSFFVVRSLPVPIFGLLTQPAKR
jgi:hypothetical protein